MSSAILKGLVSRVSHNRSKVSRCIYREYNKPNKRNWKGKKSQKDDEQLPDFQSLMRVFYRKAHPDMLRAIDSAKADVNDSSFQVLNGVLSQIKKANDYPPMMLKRLPFHVKESDGTIKLYELKLRAAGGDCRNLFIRCFSEFFQGLGIQTAPSFVWNKDYFPPASMEEVTEALKKEYEERKKDEEYSPF